MSEGNEKKILVTDKNIVVYGAYGSHGVGTNEYEDASKRIRRNRLRKGGN